MKAVEKSCVTCGDRFTVRPYRKTTANYCKVSCARAGKRTPLKVRFYSKIVAGNNGCNLWIGAKTGTGYGAIQDDAPSRKMFLAHQISYLFSKGYIPKEIDHTCRNTLCVNPLHLEDVSHNENMKRADTALGIRSAKTECPRGHEYNTDNTRHYNGKRLCRECYRTFYQRNRSNNYAKSST